MLLHGFTSQPVAYATDRYTVRNSFIRWPAACVGTGDTYGATDDIDLNEKVLLEGGTVSISYTFSLVDRKSDPVQRYERYVICAHAITGQALPIL